MNSKSSICTTLITLISPLVLFALFAFCNVFCFDQAYAAKVYIDAGHGGYDVGAVGNGYTEASLTADMANRVNAAIKNKDYDLDTYVNTSGNNFTVRGADAANRGCDIFVSLHMNSSGYLSATGTESYVYKTVSLRNSRSIDLQDSLHDRLVNATTLYNRGKKQEDFAVCRAPMPSVLLEMAFISNPSDVLIFINRRDAIADAIADGIASFAKVGKRAYSSHEGAWSMENGRWCYKNGAGVKYTDTWIVTTLAPGTDRSGEFQRYYLDGNGYLPSQGVYRINQSGTSSWFYITSGGYVLRGFYDTGYGRVYVADNEGRLAEPQNQDSNGYGWLITDKYTNGELQRYYIDGNAHAAVSSMFTVGGNKYFGQACLGYCLRNDQLEWGVDTYYADNDGVLHDISTKWVADGNTFVFYDSAQKVVNSWIVTDREFGTNTRGALQRFWVDKDGHVLSPGVYNLDLAGKNSWFYSTPSGYILRGFYDTGYGRVYVADNDGRLAEPQDPDSNGYGWLITDKYTIGELQRYYIDGNAHAAVSSTFTVAGDLYFGQAGLGYCLRNSTLYWLGFSYYANNDGVLSNTTTGWASDGVSYVYYSKGVKLRQEWIVTDLDYRTNNRGPLQRYWVDENGHVLNSGVYRLDLAGISSWFYVTSSGYVLRGFYDTGYGRVYVADNDGRLAEPQDPDSNGYGWLITDKYTIGELQRYYIDGNAHAAVSSTFTVAGDLYFGQAGLGYCLRNSRLDWQGVSYFANNDGVLTEYNAIMGYSSTNIDQMVRRYNSVSGNFPSEVYAKYGAANIVDFCRIVFEEANAEGVRAEVVFAQSMHETGWLQFGGDVKAEQCNFAGIGATGNGAPGNSFNNFGNESVRMGIRAQVQHLKAYASTLPLNNPLVDPRFQYVKRGSATTVDALGGKWAAGSGYGEALTRQINALLLS